MSGRDSGWGFSGQIESELIKSMWCDNGSHVY